MGQFRGKRYYRGKDDAELQWLEDGVGLLGKTLCHSVFLMCRGVYLICSGIHTLLTSDKTD